MHNCKTNHSYRSEPFLILTVLCLATAFQLHAAPKAKKPAVNLKADPEPAFQLRRYAWSGKLPLSILTLGIFLQAACNVLVGTSLAFVVLSVRPDVNPWPMLPELVAKLAAATVLGFNNCAISCCAAAGLPLRLGTATLYSVDNSNSGGNKPIKVTPGVYKISVAWVQPSGVPVDLSVTSAPAAAPVAFALAAMVFMAIAPLGCSDTGV